MFVNVFTVGGRSAKVECAPDTTPAQFIVLCSNVLQFDPSTATVLLGRERITAQCGDYATVKDLFRGREDIRVVVVGKRSGAAIEDTPRKPTVRSPRMTPQRTPPVALPPGPLGDTLLVSQMMQCGLDPASVFAMECKPLLMSLGYGTWPTLAPVFDSLTTEQLNTPDSGGHTVLMRIAAHGGDNSHSTDLLLDFLLRGADPNAHCDTKCGATPMMIAVEAGNLSFVRTLISSADPMICWDTDEEGETAFHMACRDGRTDIAMEILDCVVREWGSEVAQHFVTKENDIGTSPLLEAILQCDSVDLAVALIAACHVSPLCKDSENDTVLRSAMVLCGDRDVKQRLGAAMICTNTQYVINSFPL